MGTSATLEARCRAGLGRATWELASDWSSHLHQQQTEASEASQRAREACALADASSKHANELRTLTSALGVATAELNAAREELEASDAGSAVVKLETLDKELQQLEDDRRNALKIDEESSAKLEALERDGKKIEQARRQELEKLNKAAKAAKKNADGAKKALSEAEKAVEKSAGGAPGARCGLGVVVWRCLDALNATWCEDGVSRVSFDFDGPYESLRV